MPSFVAVLSFLVLAGLAASAHSAPTPRVSCDSIIQPSGSYSFQAKRVVLGVAAVPPARLPRPEPSGSRTWPYWLKSGLVIRADNPPVRVTVPARWRNRVAIGWGRAPAVSALEIASYPPTGPLGPWNAYAGGFYLRPSAACVPLTFAVGGKTATVRFGIGKRCG